MKLLMSGLLWMAAFYAVPAAGQETQQLASISPEQATSLMRSAFPGCTNIVFPKKYQTAEEQAQLYEMNRVYCEQQETRKAQEAADSSRCDYLVNKVVDGFVRAHPEEEAYIRTVRFHDSADAICRKDPTFGNLLATLPQASQEPERKKRR